jgi:NAD(P)H dehydrogenase (quinone)
MQDINVVVTFFSRTGSTEKLALAAAVGAVQARANIRLRWLRETAEDAEVDRVPGWRENRERMVKEYVAPREADFLWADALVIAVPALAPASPPELVGHLELLNALQSGGKLHARVGGALTAGPVASGSSDPTLAALYSALADLNLIVVPRDIVVPPGHAATADQVERARLQGRRVAEVARALKQATAAVVST